MNRLTGRTARAPWTRAAMIALLTAALAGDARAAGPAPTPAPAQTDRSPLLVAHALPAAGEDAGATGEQDAPAGNAMIEFFKRTDVSGLVDGYFLWALNEVDPQLRNFDIDHNAFTLNYAEIAFAKAPTDDSRAGFRLDFGAGDTAELVNAFEPGGTDYLKHVQQAYVSYLAPVGKGLTVDFGKFVTPAGAELIENKDNFNYSRGLLFSLAIPYYHAGARVAYPVTDAVTLTGFLMNGWNNVKENNDAKTVGVSLGVAATDRLSLSGNYIVGDETPEGQEGGVRNLFDLVASYSATDRLSVLGNVDYGRDEVASETVDWYGVALGLKYQVNDRWAVAPRYEIFKDSDGFATGLAQTLQEVTLTGEYLAPGGLITRFEFRSDFSDEDYFTDADDDLVSSQPTLSVARIYAFE